MSTYEMKQRLVFFIVLFISIVIGCVPTSNIIREVNYHYITNMTGKKIVHEVICNPEYVGEDTLRFLSSGATTQTEFEWKTSASFLSYRMLVGYYWHTYIHCIDDTTSVEWGGLWGVDPGFKDGNKNFRIVNLKNEKTKDGQVWPVEYYLTINDSLLFTMQKDYTMLEKFKEYYDASE
jgi:hypothetical protein